MSENVYHDHLDVCEKCRNNPMMMCPEGIRRLHQQVTGQDPGPQPGAPPSPMDFAMDAQGFSRDEAVMVKQFISELGFGSLFT